MKVNKNSWHYNLWVELGTNRKDERKTANVFLYWIEIFVFLIAVALVLGGIAFVCGFATLLVAGLIFGIDLFALTSYTILNVVFIIGVGAVVYKILEYVFDALSKTGMFTIRFEEDK